MPKKVYKLTRTPFRPGMNKIQTTSRSKLDWGTMNDLRNIDEYFAKLFTSEAENIKKLGLDVNSLSLTVAQISNIG